MKAEAPAPGRDVQAHQLSPAAAAVLAHADLRPGLETLVAFAGRGGLLHHAAAVTRAADAIEPDFDRWAEIAGAARTALCADFSVYRMPGQYDRVLIAAPMSAHADIGHVQHGLHFLRPGGLLVAVVCAAALAALRPVLASSGGRAEAVTGMPGLVTVIIPAAEG